MSLTKSEIKKQNGKANIPSSEVFESLISSQEKDFQIRFYGSSSISQNPTTSNTPTLIQGGN